MYEGLALAVGVWIGGVLTLVIFGYVSILDKYQLRKYTSEHDDDCRKKILTEISTMIMITDNMAKRTNLRTFKRWTNVMHDYEKYLRKYHN